MIFIGFFSMLYYFVGTFLFSSVAAYAMFLQIQAPILSLGTIYDEAKSVREGEHKQLKFKYLRVTKNLFWYMCEDIDFKFNLLTHIVNHLRIQDYLRSISEE